MQHLSSRVQSSRGRLASSKRSRSSSVRLELLPFASVHLRLFSVLSACIGCRQEGVPPESDDVNDQRSHSEWHDGKVDRLDWNPDRPVGLERREPLVAQLLLRILHRSALGQRERAEEEEPAGSAWSVVYGAHKLVGVKTSWSSPTRATIVAGFEANSTRFTAEWAARVDATHAGQAITWAVLESVLNFIGRD